MNDCNQYIRLVDYSDDKLQKDQISTSPPSIALLVNLILDHLADKVTSEKVNSEVH